MEGGWKQDWTEGDGEQYAVVTEASADTQEWPKGDVCKDVCYAPVSLQRRQQP